MPYLARIVVNWTGFVGAPGYTNLFFRSPGETRLTQAQVDAAANEVDFWINSWKPVLPNTVTIGVDPSVAEIDAANGQLQTFFSTAVNSPEAGTGTGNYSAASGAVVSWSTEMVRHGRRVRGRTFIVPLAGSALDTDGSINSTQLSNLRLAATNFQGSGVDDGFCVWARPIPEKPGPPVVPAEAGFPAMVNGVQIKDKAAILRSRRD